MEPAPYIYREGNTWALPTKIAQFLGENHGDVLEIDSWDSVVDLNRILRERLVADANGDHLHTFHCIEWEHEECDGVAVARCTPFSSFHNKNVKVCTTHRTLSHVIACISHLVPHAHRMFP